MNNNARNAAAQEKPQKSSKRTAGGPNVSSIFDNPHFEGAERAPYRLGCLLRQMPPRSGGAVPLPANLAPKAEAIAQHAENARSTLRHGIEAIGQVLYIASINKTHPLGAEQVADLGSLITHLAQELQFLEETQEDFEHALQHAKRTDGQKGGV